MTASTSRSRASSLISIVLKRKFSWNVRLKGAAIKLHTKSIGERVQAT
jgi:hypothetical protein